MILLTGATGFLGSNLLRSLLTAGERVRVVIRDYHKLKSILNEIEFDPNLLDIREDDLTSNSLNVTFLVNDVDTIIHTAAYVSVGSEDLEKMTAVNVGFTQKILQVLKPHHYFLFLGSVAVFGPTTEQPENESKSLPTNGSPYELTKRKATLLVREANERGQRCGLLHPGIVYGKGAHGSLTRYAKLVARKRLPIFTGLKSKGSFVFIEDVVRASLKMIQSHVQNEYILGGEVTSFGSFLGEIASATHGRAPQLNLSPHLLLPISKLCRGVAELFQSSFPLTPTLIQAANKHWAYESTLIQTDMALSITDIKTGVRKWVSSW